MNEESDRIDDLITDQMYLRKSFGFVAGRIYEASTFISVIGGKNQIFESIKVRFIAAIYSLQDKQNAESLLAAYGLLPGYEAIPLLRDRRAKYGQQVKRKYDTLADREIAAINELAIRLLTSYYSGAPLPAELPMPHGGFLMDYLYVTTVIQDRNFVSHQQTRKIISLVEGAKGFEYQSNSKTTLIPIDGIEVKTRYVKNGTVHTLIFSKPLKRGETHIFTFNEIMDEAESNEPTPTEDFAGQSFETPTLNYVQKVIFKDGKPPILWFYDKLSRIVRPGEPGKNNQLEVSKDGTIQREFTQLYGGLFSGIAWRWK